MKELFLLLLFIGSASMAQDISKDTLRMKPILIEKNQARKVKIKSFRYMGSSSLHNPLLSEPEVLTLVDMLPEGYLHSVSFWFNNFMEINNYPIEAQDTDVELLAYEVNPDNTPGNRIEHETNIIKVTKDFAGKMTIDLSELNILSKGKIYIGLRRLTPSASNNTRQEFEVNFVCNSNTYTSYIRKLGSSAWLKSDNAFEMEVKLEAL